MHARKLVFAVSLAWIAVAGLSAQSKPLPRLRVSENGRFFVKEGGAPFFYLGDTAWCLFTRPTHEEVDLYLTDRASKGFTVIQGVFLIWDGLKRPNPLGQTLLVNKNAAQINAGLFRERRLHCQQGGVPRPVCAHHAPLGQDLSRQGALPV